MPMAKEEDFGTYNDGSSNEEFCRYCFQEGKFTEPDITLEGMVQKSVAILKQMQVPEAQIEQTKAFIPMLKRWRGR